MNLGITTFGSDGGRSGIGRYTTNLIRGLTRLGQADVDLYAFHDEQATFAPGDGTANCLPFPTWLKPPVMNIAWHQWSLAGWCRKRRHDVLFLPAGNRRLPLHCPCPTVGTIHDFSSLHVANKYNAARLVYIKQVLPPTRTTAHARLDRQRIEQAGHRRICGSSGRKSDRDPVGRRP